MSTQFNKIVEIIYEADLWAEEDGADLDALEAEVKSINEELEARKEAEAQKAEIRAEVANGAGEIRERMPFSFNKACIAKPSV